MSKLTSYTLIVATVLTIGAFAAVSMKYCANQWAEKVGEITKVERLINNR